MKRDYRGVRVAGRETRGREAQMKREEEGESDKRGSGGKGWAGRVCGRGITEANKGIKVRLARRETRG